MMRDRCVGYKSAPVVLLVERENERERAGKIRQQGKEEEREKWCYSSISW